MDISGKAAIVTGASSGIGEATCRHLAKEGAYVVAGARRGDRLDTLVDQINGAGGKAEAYVGDVTNKDDCEKIARHVIESRGSIDILVNNAGVMLLGPAKEAPLEEWERMIQVNLLGLLYMTKAALRALVEAEGHLVNISSVAGRTAGAGSAVYNATKWGVGALTEALRQELVADGTHMRTTIIEPGAVETELASHNRPEVQEVLKKRWQGISKKLAADDIARSIVFAVTQPPHVNVNEILIRPTDQPL